MPKVSIIVPIYNSEAHLSRCIDSILAQTYSNFELILVNDGSIDNSGNICDEYAQNNSRIIVKHKENGGVSSARNYGLEIANGEYITFVDSDDTISTNYLSSFSFGADFEIAGLETIGNKEEISIPNTAQLLSTNKEITDWFIYNYNSLYVTTICSKLFRRDIIQANSLQFDTLLKRGEDTIFVYNYLSYCKKIKLTPSVIYQYNFEPTIIGNRYSLNAIDCVNHIQSKVASIERLEHSLNVKFADPKRLSYTTYLHLFYTHLKSSSKDEKKNEIRSFRKNSNALQLWKDLSLKNYIYWRLLPTQLIAK